MKLLIVTQAVDTRHSNLGFFVKWIEEFSKNAESVIVIANEVGEYTLPANVKVYTLGKESRASRLPRYARFASLVTDLSAQYDTVFCHMNPEFVLAGALWWKLKGKRIGFWYMHKGVTVRLRLAAALADCIFTASPESFRLKSAKLHIVGHGIDTDTFRPDLTITRGTHWLSVGRLTKSKRHDKAIDKAVDSNKELRIAGEGPEREFLEQYAKSKDAKVTFLGGLTHSQLRDEYLRAERLVHYSETGSLDKVLLEALACGLSITTEYPPFLESKEKELLVQSYKILIPKIISVLQT